MLTQEEIVAKADREVADASLLFDRHKTPEMQEARRTSLYGIYDRFRKNLEALHDLKTEWQDKEGVTWPDLPKEKLDLLWRYAWREGHSAGFHEVASIYAELAPLLKD